jgi:hypothetical protein
MSLLWNPGGIGNTHRDRSLGVYGAVQSAWTAGGIVRPQIVVMLKDRLMEERREG